MAADLIALGLDLDETQARAAHQHQVGEAIAQAIPVPGHHLHQAGDAVSRRGVEQAFDQLGQALGPPEEAVFLAGVAADGRGNDGVGLALADGVELLGNGAGIGRRETAVLERFRHPVEG